MNAVVASEFVLQASARLRGFNALLHGGLAVVVTLALWPQRPLALLALLGLLIAHAVSRDRLFALRSSNAIRQLRHDADGWSLAVSANEWQPIRLTAATTVTSHFVVLAWAAGSGQNHYLLLTPGMLPEGQFRRMCRLLWQAETSATESAPSV